MGTARVASVRAAAAYLDALSDDEACAELSRCCGATDWVDGMLAARPFRSDAVLFETAQRLWWELAPAQWKEAFAAHPRVGERATRQSATREWSAKEQAGVAQATEATRVALAQGNRAYEARFGHVFLVCASGLSGDEMLQALKRRLDNTPAEELRIAAGEQAKITRLRLEKLVQP